VPIQHKRGPANSGLDISEQDRLDPLGAEQDWTGPDLPRRQADYCEEATSAGPETTDFGVELDLDAATFMSAMVASFADNLERLVGRAEAQGYVSTVGTELGEALNQKYAEALASANVPRDRLAAVLVDLKRRIEGDFFVQEDRGSRIVLGNRRCPFGRHVDGKPALCMMTSNVFGVIAAESAGFARVTLDQTIADGHATCRIAVDLDPAIRGDPAAADDRSRDYYKA